MAEAHYAALKALAKAGKTGLIKRDVNKLSNNDLEYFVHANFVKQRDDALGTYAITDRGRRRYRELKRMYESYEEGERIRFLHGGTWHPGFVDKVTNIDGETAYRVKNARGGGLIHGLKDTDLQKRESFHEGEMRRLPKRVTDILDGVEGPVALEDLLDLSHRILPAHYADWQAEISAYLDSQHKLEEPIEAIGVRGAGANESKLSRRMPMLEDIVQPGETSGDGPLAQVNDLIKDSEGFVDAKLANPPAGVTAEDVVRVSAPDYLSKSKGDYVMCYFDNKDFLVLKSDILLTGKGKDEKVAGLNEDDHQKQLQKLNMKRNSLANLKYGKSFSELTDDEKAKVVKEVNQQEASEARLERYIRQKLVVEGKSVEEMVDEGFLGKLIGGITGFTLGKKIGEKICKVLGIEKGILYDLFTSRIFGTAIGAAIGGQ
jgi:hypothetical protein